MINKKIWSLRGPILAIIVAVCLAGFYKELSTEGAQSLASAQTRRSKVPDDFNWKAYVNNYSDLQKAGINTEERAKEHWLNWGEKEGRNYREIQTPSALTKKEHDDPKLLISPAKQGKDGPDVRKPQTPPTDIKETLPPNFDWMTYVENYKDLQKAGIDTKAKAAEHWLKIGKKEGRTYHEISLEVPDVPYMPWQRKE